MSYLYDCFEVKEKRKSYVVTREIPGEERISARISKDIVERVETGEDKEMVAIICAVVEFVRFDAKKSDGSTERTLLNQDEFAESLTFLLNHECSEEIILEFSQQKYHELKQRFS